MKYLFYTILLVGSLGTVGAMLNPALVQQGAALVGLELSQNSTDTDEKPSGEDRLAEFLEQYPFIANRNSATVPGTSPPAVAMPAPPPAPNSAYNLVPATPFPAPVVEMPAPVYANPVFVEPVQPAANWDNSNWDSTAVIPIYSPPAIEYHLPPAPQQSVYATANPPSPPSDASAPYNAFPFVYNTVADDMSPGFAQTRTVSPQPTTPPIQLPVTSPQTAPTFLTQTPPPPNGAPQTQAVLIEKVPVLGTETVARVGTQVILMGDILPKLRRTAQKIIAANFEQMPEEERAKVTQPEIEQVFNTIATSLYPEVLQERILFDLVYNDYLSQQAKEQKDMFDERLGEEFDRKEVPEMMKEFDVENVADLKRALEQRLGSSLEKEKRLWIREQIVRQWISMSIQRATGEATQDEMLDYYEKNQAMFTSLAKARWQEMTVLFSRHNSAQEAENKMRWMGNQVAGGASFEEIARTLSDGFTASEGGVWDWTTKGSLTSLELEKAIFSQPIGALSPAIIKSDKGLHIIRVVERQEEKVVPFVEAQVTIRERIKNQRTQQQQDEYLAELRRRFPTVVARDHIDFDINTTRTASSVR